MDAEERDFDNLLSSLQLSPSHHGSTSSSAAEEGDSRWRSTIYCKLLTTDKPVHFKSIQSTLSTIWMRFNLVSIKQLPNGLFSAEFTSPNDINQLQEMGPWCFQQDFILIQKVVSGLKLQDYTFNSIVLWVQLHGIPKNYLNIKMVEHILHGFGNLLPIDPILASNWNHFARVQILFKADFKLKSSASTQLLNGGILEADIVYERVTRFCSICCMLGHQDATCPTQLLLQSKLHSCASILLKDRILSAMKPKISNAITTQFYKMNSMRPAAVSEDNQSVSTFEEALSEHWAPSSTFLANQQLANRRINPNISQQVCLHPSLNQFDPNTSNNCLSLSNKIDNVEHTTHISHRRTVNTHKLQQNLESSSTQTTYGIGCSDNARVTNNNSTAQCLANNRNFSAVSKQVCNLPMFQQSELLHVSDTITPCHSNAGVSSQFQHQAELENNTKVSVIARPQQAVLEKNTMEVHLLDSNSDKVLNISSIPSRDAAKKLTKLETENSFTTILSPEVLFIPSSASPTTNFDRCSDILLLNYNAYGRKCEPHSSSPSNNLCQRDGQISSNTSETISCSRKNSMIYQHLQPTTPRIVPPAVRNMGTENRLTSILSPEVTAVNDLSRKRSLPSSPILTDTIMSDITNVNVDLSRMISTDTENYKSAGKCFKTSGLNMKKIARSKQHGSATTKQCTVAMVEQKFD